MKYLPLVMTRGLLLAQLVRESSQDPRRYRSCGCCGARMAITPDRSEQMARCPGCLRVQRVAEDGEDPWRLTPASAEALRRTKSWVRWV
ncbi:MAG: hypothetical protein ABSC95_05510 [Acetobacteraceae bacterium]|jgi:hypothetical protein